MTWRNRFQRWVRRVWYTPIPHRVRGLVNLPDGKALGAWSFHTHPDPASPSGYYYITTYVSRQAETHVLILSYRYAGRWTQRQLDALLPLIEPQAHHQGWRLRPIDVTCMQNRVTYFLVAVDFEGRLV